MRVPKRYVAISTLILVVAPQPGCLERKERITVMPDGRVRMMLRYEGDPGDFDNGDAMPSKMTGWDTLRTQEGEGEDESVLLVSEQTFDAGAALPETYAASNDPDQDLYLRFPTALTIQRRADGTYYHFSRRYPGRRWAYVQYWQDLIFQGEDQRTTDQPAKELTREERLELIKKFAAVEAFKQVEFAKEALDHCAPDVPQMPRTLLRQKLLHVFRADPILSDTPSPHLLENGTYLKNLVARCDPLSERERNDCYDAEAQKVLAMSHDALVQSLRDDAGFDDAAVATFDRAFARAKLRYKITEALGGHRFDICVTMPGRIVAHNADKVTDTPESPTGDNRVCWEMEGKAVRDREVEMFVSSFVPTQHPDQ